MITLLQLIIGAALALKWEICVVNQHFLLVVVSWSLSWSRSDLACSSCLQILEEGVFIRANLPRLQLQSVETTGIAGCDLPFRLYLSSLG